MTLFNINANLIRVIENLYNKATSAVYLNGEIGDWFRTTVGVRQGCLLSRTLFNIFRERIMTEALDDHKGTVNIGGRTITNLRFANNIDGLAGKEEELASLVNRREKDLFTLWKLPKTKLTTNNTDGIRIDMRVNGGRLGEVGLGAVVTDQGSKPKVLSRIAHTTAALTRLKTLETTCKYISLNSKILKFILFVSVMLYSCET